MNDREDLNRPVGLSREELYQKWYAWAAENLGSDDKLGVTAANAADDIVDNGGGFNAAAEAATIAWNHAGKQQSDRESIRRIVWGCRIAITIPIVIDAAVIAVSETTTDLWPLVVIFRGVPLAYLILAAVLSAGSFAGAGAARGVTGRYAALATALAFGSFIIPILLVFAECQATPVWGPVLP